MPQKTIRGRYRANEPIVEAMQYNGENTDKVKAFLGGKHDGIVNGLVVGMWVTQEDASGRVIICGDAIFRANYATIEEHAEP